MAIIYSYPKISSLAGNDTLVITDISDNKKPTKRVSLSQLRSFLRVPTSGPGGVVTKIIPGTNITISPVDGTGDVTINSTGSISGSGTTNTLPIWSDGPNGVLGDSVITFSPSPNLGEWNFNGSAVNVGGNSFFKRVSIRGAGSNIVGDFTNFTFKNIMFYMSINPGNPAVETSRVWQGLYKNNTAVKNGLHWSFGSYSTSPNSAFIIGDDKSIQMPGYGSGTITGTKTYDLAVDTDGNIIESTDTTLEQTFVLTAAQMQGLTTPFQLLAAPGANKTYKILELSTYLNFQSQFSATGSGLNFFTTDQPTPLIEVGQSVSDSLQYIAAGTTVTGVTSQAQIEINPATSNSSGFDMPAFHSMTFTRTDGTTFTRTSFAGNISNGSTTLQMALANITGGDGLQCGLEIFQYTANTSVVYSNSGSSFSPKPKLYINQPLMVSSSSNITGGTGSTFSIKIKYQILDTNNF